MCEQIIVRQGAGDRGSTHTQTRATQQLQRRGGGGGGEGGSKKVFYRISDVISWFLSSSNF